jgi:hypothetical protein
MGMIDAHIFLCILTASDLDSNTHGRASPWPCRRSLTMHIRMQGRERRKIKAMGKKRRQKEESLDD